MSYIELGFLYLEKIKKSVQFYLFLIPTTIIFDEFPFHQRTFFINLGLIGGLIIDALRGPK